MKIHKANTGSRIKEMKCIAASVDSNLIVLICFAQVFDPLLPMEELSISCLALSFSKSWKILSVSGYFQTQVLELEV